MSTSSRVPVLALPGLRGPEPEHWQSYWERIDPACRQVEHADWLAPHIHDWSAELTRAVDTLSEPAVLAAHSSSCILVAYWAANASARQLARVRGALLVAPSDPDGPNYPAGPRGFSPMPLDRLPFPSIVVASRDDTYVTLERAAEYAAAWGSRFVEIGAAGHINTASGLGAWPVGYALVNELRTAPLAGATRA
jgi:predicted alpha/beta hydrolase family esterase